MATNIGKLNVVLTASANGLTSVLNSAAKQVTSFGSSVKSAVTGIPGILAGLAGGASLAGIGMLVKSTAESVGALHDQSIALGVSTEALSRLQYAAQFAGVDSETLNNSLGKMMKNAADAAAGGEEAANAFSKLGLNAQALTMQSPDESFKQVADALKKVENPYQRAQLAMEVFGKSGRALIPVMADGRAGIEAMAEQSDKLGITISSIDAENIDRAGDSFDAMMGILQGIANTVTAFLAPIVEDLSMRLIGAAASGEGMGKRVTGAMESVAKGIAYASDYLNLFKVGFYGLRAAVGEALGWIISKVAAVGESIIELLNLLPGVNMEVDRSLSNLAQSMREIAGEDAAKMNEALEDFHNGKNAAAVSKYFDEVKKKADETSKAAVAANAEMAKPTAAIEMKKTADETAKTIDNLTKQIRQFSMTATEKALDDAAALGASDEQLSSIEIYSKELEKLNSLKDETNKLDELAKKIHNDNPYVKAQEDLENLIKLLETGRISQEEFNAARDKIADGLPDDAKKKASENVAPRLLAAGSQEAFKLVSQIEQRMKGEKQDTPKQQLAAQLKAAKTLDEMLSVLKSGKANGELAIAEIKV